MTYGCIFDMDGTLFDTEALLRPCWIEAGARLHVTPPIDADFHQAIIGICGNRIHDVIRQLRPGFDPKLIHETAYALFAERIRNSVPEKPGLHECLELLAAHGIRLAIASSTRRTRVLDSLARTHIDSFFDAVITGNDVTRGKPDPEPFLLAAQALHLPPSQCFVVEDGFNGIRAAHAAGCTAIMVPDLVPPDDEMRRLATTIVPTLLDAANWILASC